MGPQREGRWAEPECDPQHRWRGYSPCSDECHHVVFVCAAHSPLVGKSLCSHGEGSLFSGQHFEWFRGPAPEVEAHGWFEGAPELGVSPSCANVPMPRHPSMQMLITFLVSKGSAVRDGTFACEAPHPVDLCPWHFGPDEAPGRSQLATRSAGSVARRLHALVAGAFGKLISCECLG
jgi:hypothetical protein